MRNNLGRNNHRNELHNNTMVFYSRWVRKVIVVVCCSCQIDCVCFFFSDENPTADYLVLYVCFVDRCLSFCTFSFGHCVVCSSSIYGFWLPLSVSSNSSSYVLSLSVQYLNNLSYFVNIMCLHPLLFTIFTF